jgi:glycosyltransferase
MLQERIIRNRIGGEYDLKKVASGWLPLSYCVLKKAVIDKYEVLQI